MRVVTLRQADIENSNYFACLGYCYSEEVLVVTVRIQGGAKYVLEIGVAKASADTLAN